MHGSGAVFCSCSLLIRGPILPAVRQKLHLSPCADSRSRLCYSTQPRSRRYGHGVTRSRRKPPRRRCRPTSSLGRSDRPLALLLSSLFSCVAKHYSHASWSLRSPCGICCFAPNICSSLPWYRSMGNLLFWLGLGAAQKGAGSKEVKPDRHWVISFVVGILLALLIAAGAFILLVSQR